MTTCDIVLVIVKARQHGLLTFETALSSFSSVTNAGQGVTFVRADRAPHSNSARRAAVVHPRA